MIVPQEEKQGLGADHILLQHTLQQDQGSAHLHSNNLPIASSDKRQAGTKGAVLI